MTASRFREIPFSGCVVRVFDDARYLETVFPDGTRVPASPEDTDAYRATARRLGYGDDTWRQCLEHEVLHTLVAERVLFHAYSPTLWRVAHGETRAAPVNLEEPIVFAAQRALNAFVIERLLVDLCGGDERFAAFLDEARRILRSPDPAYLEYRQAMAAGQWADDPRD